MGAFGAALAAVVVPAVVVGLGHFQPDVGLDDAGDRAELLAELARMSVRASAAPDDVRTRLMGGIDGWLAREDVARER